MLKIISMYSSDIVDSTGEFVDFRKIPNQKKLTINITLVIGFDGKTGSHDFNALVVCGVKPEEFFQLNPITEINRRAIFLDKVDGEEIAERITTMVNSCERSDWDGSLTELRRYFYWEYE